MPKHVKSAFLQRSKGKACCRNGCQSSRQSPPDYFFLCCDISPFVISSDLLPLQPEPLLLSLDFNSVQYCLVPFGCHLDYKSSLSKRDTAARKEMTGCLRSSPALLPKSVLRCCHPADRSQFRITVILIHSLFKGLN